MAARDQRGADRRGSASRPGRSSQLVDETARAAGTPATAENVRKAFTTLRGQVGKDDLVLVVLLGHGTFDGDQAKFNLVGPDLTAGEWSVMLGALPGRVVVVNTTESSAPFIEALAAKGRVVITATDTGAQKYATVFPEYFAKALADTALGPRQERQDLDLGGVRRRPAARSARHYTERAQLTTERAVLSDTGREDRACRRRPPGQQGTLARSLFLDRDGDGGERQSRSAGAHRPAPGARGRCRGAHPEEAGRRSGGVERRVRAADDRAGAGLARDPPAILRFECRSVICAGDRSELS